ncbi:MAG TPA: hypothetical protein VGJ95_13450 [Pseudonocardiaceae bacterium]
MILGDLVGMVVTFGPSRSSRAAGGTEFWLSPPKALARYAFEHPFAVVSVYPLRPSVFQDPPLPVGGDDNARKSNRRAA